MQRSSYKVLPPDRQQSAFKVKVYFANGGEATYFSYDFEHERRYFEVTPKEIVAANIRKNGHQMVAEFNGFKRILDFLDKLSVQGRLKLAIIYANQVPEQGPDGNNWAMEIVKVNPPKNNTSNEKPQNKA